MATEFGKPVNNGIVEVFSLDMITALENRMTRSAALNPDSADAVRFLVSQIILKGIALAKDPKVETKRVKDLYELAMEVLAQGDLMTGVEQARITDLINAIVEGDDINVSLRTFKADQAAQLAALREDILTSSRLTHEEIVLLGETISKVKLESTTKKKFSWWKISIIIMVSLSVLLFTIVSLGAIIAAYLDSTSQLEISRSRLRQQQGVYDAPIKPASTDKPEKRIEYVKEPSFFLDIQNRIDQKYEIKRQNEYKQNAPVMAIYQNVELPM